MLVTPGDGPGFPITPHIGPSSAARFTIIALSFALLIGAFVLTVFTF